MSPDEKFRHELSERLSLWGRLRAATSQNRRVVSPQKFPVGIRTELRSGYLRLRGNAAGAPHWKEEADIFVRTLEGWGRSIQLFKAATPAIQKLRKRSLKSLEMAILKIDEVLNDLDSEALGLLYANVACAINDAHPSDTSATPAADQHLRSVVEGLELRISLRETAGLLVSAILKTRDALPKFDYVANHPCLKTAQQLERLMLDHRLPFESREDGFAAQCLREMLSLSDPFGQEDKKVSYWLDKIVNSPDSYARFLQDVKSRSL